MVHTQVARKTSPKLTGKNTLEKTKESLLKVACRVKTTTI